MEGITAGTSAEQPPELVIHSETPAPPAAPIDWERIKNIKKVPQPSAGRQ